MTEWAVAPIPASDPGRDAGDPSGPAASASGSATAVLAPSVPPPSLAVDDEPEEASARVAPNLPSPREGDVIDADEPPADDDDNESVDLDVMADQAPVLARRIARMPDGTQRYGEAVVRQLLGARFVREEPHASPTRFG